MSLFKTYEALPKKVNAVRFTEENKDQVFNDLHGNRSADFENGFPILRVTTIHGDTAVVRLGDWIAEDAEIGTYYPIKDGIFRSGYV